MITLPSIPISAPAISAPVSKAGRTPAEILRQLQDRLPRTKMIGSQRTPIPGITAIQLASGQQVYAADGSNYLIIGVIYDLNTGKTLQQTLQENTSAGRPSSKGHPVGLHQFIATKDGS